MRRVCCPAAAGCGSRAPLPRPAAKPYRAAPPTVKDPAAALPRSPPLAARPAVHAPPFPQENGSTRARLAAAVAAEFVGTFLFALIGGAAPAKKAAWANGIALMVLVFATANVSGARTRGARGRGRRAGTRRRARRRR